MMRGIAGIAGSLCAVACICAAGADWPDPGPPPKWWNADWSYRLRIRIPLARGESMGSLSGAETAVVPDLWLGRRCLPDASDLRVTDGAGQPINFRVAGHEAGGQTILQVQVPVGQFLDAWLYFGNSNAFPIVTARADEFAAEWDRRVGVELRVYRKEKPGLARTLDELRRMIEAAGKPEGAAFVDTVAHAYNPFGESDNFIGVYDGYLRVEIGGKQNFMAYADDGCWVLMDGKEVLAWPGPRPPGRDLMDGRPFSVDLEPGLHRVQFFHDEGDGDQIAFLRWQPPNAPILDNISRHSWAYSRRGYADIVQAKDRPICAMVKPRVRHTYWIPETTHQINWIAAQDLSCSGGGRIVSRRFEMDDGTVYDLGEGATEAQHVFFSTGARSVTLVAKDDKGNVDTVTADLRIWPVDVEAPSEIVAAHDPLARLLGTKGHLPVYLQYLDHLSNAPPYHVERMTEEDLAGYTIFWSTFDDDTKTMAGLGELLKRQASTGVVDRVAAAGLKSALRSGTHADLAERMLARLESGNHDPVRAHELALQRVQLLVWGKGDYAAARQSIDVVRARLRERDDEVARRRVLIAEGDINLLTGAMAKATAAYDLAEKNDPRRLTRAAKLATVGSYPFAVEDYLSRGMYEEAVDVISRWEDLLPRAKVEGLTLHLRGKALYLMRSYEPALKYLRVAKAVNPGGLHVPESGWLTANSLMALDRYEEAIVEFLRVRDGLSTLDYQRRAVEKIEECRRKIEADGRRPETSVRSE